MFVVVVKTIASSEEDTARLISHQHLRDAEHGGPIALLALQHHGVVTHLRSGMGGLLTWLRYSQGREGCLGSAGGD